VRSGAAVHLSLASLSEVAPPGIRLVPVDMPAAPVFLTWVRDRVPGHVLDFVHAAEAGAGAGAAEAGTGAGAGAGAAEAGAGAGVPAGVRR
jgi:hypothetical protein